MLINCMWGLANFPNASCSITIRYRQDKYSNALPLLTCLRADNTLKMSRYDRANASRVQLVGNGYIDTAVFDAPESSILLVDYRYTCASIGINKIIQLRLRLREGAPLNKLKLTLPNDANAVNQYAYIDGRFDVLTEEDVKSEKLLKQTEYNPRLLDHSRWGNLVNLEQIETGSKQLVRTKFVEIKTKSGNTIAMPARKARLIKLKGDKRNDTN